jgi:hypothetical protein
MVSSRFYLINDTVRRNAVQAVMNAGENFVVTISEPKRSLEQNAKLWAMLGDVASAKPEGRNWTPETWKSAFMHAIGHQVRFAEGLDGSGPFPIGFSSSKLSVREMADLIIFISEYGDRHRVKWSETIKGGWTS